MLKRNLILCSLSVFMGGCNLFHLAGEIGNVKNYSESDERMNTAIAEAQESLPLFVEVLQAPGPLQTAFSIKVKLLVDEDGGAEHLWVDDITYNNGQFAGFVANEPVYVKNIHLGDSITVNTEDVSDWMYFDGDRLVGGFTIHVYLDGLSEVEKAKFEEENGYLVSEKPLLPE